MVQDKQNMKKPSIRMDFKPTTVVPYPDEELDNLRKCLKLNGVTEMIRNSTRISKPTIRRIADCGHGGYDKVCKLRYFVKKFLKATA